MHRDLKFENIMFESDKPEAEIKLIDFGLSTKYKKGATCSAKVGTVYTMSPEVLRGAYNQQADMWSIGVVTYQLLSGDKPFWGSDLTEIAQNVVKAEYNFNGPQWEHISIEAKDFIRHLLQVEPHLRYTADQALTAPWLDTLTKSALVDMKADSSTSLTASFNSLPEKSTFRSLAFQVVARKATTSEIMELRNIFHSIDVNHDGVISVEELKQGLGSCYSEKEMEEWFAHADVDQDGSINYTEFLATTLEGKGELELVRIAEAFELFDKEEKGYITPANLREILGGCEDSDYIDKLIQEADTNQDGRISFGEFKDVMGGQRKAQIAAVEEGFDIPQDEPLLQQ
jgi:calcium-dependent protein kinase